MAFISETNISKNKKKMNLSNSASLIGKIFYLYGLKLNQVFLLIENRDHHRDVGAVLSLGRGHVILHKFAPRSNPGGKGYTMARKLEKSKPGQTASMPITFGGTMS